MISETMSSRIKALRTKKNLTLKQLGQEVNLQKSSLSDIENAKSPISLDSLVRLADYFDVSLDYLVGRSDDPARR